MCISFGHDNNNNNKRKQGWGCCSMAKMFLHSLRSAILCTSMFLFLSIYVFIHNYTRIFLGKKVDLAAFFESNAKSIFIPKALARNASNQISHRPATNSQASNGKFGKLIDRRSCRDVVWHQSRSWYRHFSSFFAPSTESWDRQMTLSRCISIKSWLFFSLPNVKLDHHQRIIS